MALLRPPNPAILVWRKRTLAARILPAEMKAAPKTHPAVVSTTGHNLSITSTHALAAAPQTGTRIMPVKSAPSAMGTTPEHRNAIQVILTRHHQNSRGTDVHAALRPNQMCHHRNIDVTAIGTAPYHLHQLPHTPHPQAAHLHLAVDTAVTDAGTAANTDDVTALALLPSHPSHVLLRCQDTCRTG